MNAILSFECLKVTKNNEPTRIWCLNSAIYSRINFLSLFSCVFFLQDWYYRIAGYPTKSLKGELVLITGAGGGLGRLLAIRMTRLGAKLILWDISKEGECELFLKVWIYLTGNSFFLRSERNNEHPPSDGWRVQGADCRYIEERRGLQGCWSHQGDNGRCEYHGLIFFICSQLETVEMSKGSSCISSSEWCHLGCNVCLVGRQQNFCPRP